MAEQEVREYRQGDIIRLPVELQDPNGIRSAAVQAFLEGEHGDDEGVPEIELFGWPEGEGGPERAEFVLEAEVKQEPPGVYRCAVLVANNTYQAFSRHEIDPPMRFRIVERPDDVREGPEVLSVGEFF